MTISVKLVDISAKIHRNYISYFSCSYFLRGGTLNYLPQTFERPYSNVGMPFFFRVGTIMYIYTLEWPSSNFGTTFLKHWNTLFSTGLVQWCTYIHIAWHFVYRFFNLNCWYKDFRECNSGQQVNGNYTPFHFRLAASAKSIGM